MIFVTAALSFLPLALAAATPSATAESSVPSGYVPLDPAPGQGQHIRVYGRPDLCVSAAGLPPKAGTKLVVTYCLPNALALSPVQLWDTEGIDSTAPVKLFGTDLCVDAGTTPTDGTPLALAKCSGAASQSWYWFGASSLEVNNECWSAVPEGSVPLQNMQTFACTPFNATQMFEIRNGTATTA